MSNPGTPELTLPILAGELGKLHAALVGWLASSPLSLTTEHRTKLESQASDLERGAKELAEAKPLLAVMLMGGTGVGKSSLLNALARGSVAVASFTRPTTRDPVVYHHREVSPDRLPTELRKCKLVAHDRPALAQKILIDTPDLDSNEPQNRDKLEEVLPVADVVLYVGSQEKYHDQAGWEMFLRQKQRRAFAFVLNKWDRCLHGLATGLRPDEDLLRDLKDNGFSQPLMFRTCAQAWVEANGQPRDLPAGEQFQDLERWLEEGLNRLEIEAIKTRGVGQLLHDLGLTLATAKPADVAAAARATEAAWEKTLGDEAIDMGDLLLATVDPYQRDVEKHFAWHTHQHFRGLMAVFLGLAARLRYWSGSWGGLTGQLLSMGSGEAPKAGAWDLSAFSRACLKLAGERFLDARLEALPNRLVVQADEAGLPAATFAAQVEAAAKADWRSKLGNDFSESLHQAESELTRPAGPRRWTLELLVRIGEFLPLIVLLLTSFWLIHDYFIKSPRRDFAFSDLLLPFFAVLLGMVILFVIIQVALPVRWTAIRGALAKRLRQRLKGALAAVYRPLPARFADKLAQERQQAEALERQAKGLARWVERHEGPPPVTALFEETAP